MKTLKILTAVLIIIIGVMIYYAVKNEKTESAREQAVTTEQSAKNEGPDSSLIVANVGDQFTVQLESNPTTGYDWVSEFDSDLIEQTDKEFVSKADSGLVGAPGVTIFHFKASVAGESQIVFNYKRAWETDIPPTKVEVKKIQIVDSIGTSEAERLKNIAAVVAANYLKAMDDFKNMSGVGVETVQVEEARCPGCYLVKLQFDSKGQTNFANVVLENWVAKSAIIEKAK